MGNSHVPTVFVAVLVGPNQLGLFHEMEAEALDIMAGVSMAPVKPVSHNHDRVVMDCDCARVALGWQTLPVGDVLTFAVGARPGHTSSSEDMKVAAALMRQLDRAASALFEVEETVWQIAMLPLTKEAMDQHAKQLVDVNANGDTGTAVPFVTIEPKAEERPDEMTPSKSGEDLVSQVMAAFDEANKDPSWAMQMSALALSTAFVLVTPPVGAAMFTYAALRQGKDMDLLARGTRSQPMAGGPVAT